MTRNCVLSRVTPLKRFAFLLTALYVDQCALLQHPVAAYIYRLSRLVHIL